MNYSLILRSEIKWIHRSTQQIEESQREGGGGKRLIKDSICILAQPMNTDNNALKARGVGGSGEEGSMWGGKGSICNTFNNKDTFKK